MADDFVTMIKDGETIRVSPLTVEDHQRLGWQVAEEPASAPEPQAPAAISPPKGKTPTSSLAEGPRRGTGKK